MSFGPEEIAEFKEEALELLEAAEGSLMELDEGADFSAHYDVIFRSLHNLKGSAGMMEMEELQKHTHKLEDLLVSMKGQAKLPPDYISLFLKGVDAARSLLTGQCIEFQYEPSSTISTQPKGTSASASEERTFLTECEDLIERMRESILSLKDLEDHSNEPALLDSLFRDIHTFKGNAYLFSRTEIGGLANSMEEIVSGIQPGQSSVTQENYESLLQLLFEIEKKLEGTTQQESSAPSVVTPDSTKETAGHKVEAAAASTVRVAVPLLDKLMNLMSEMVLVRNQVIQHPHWQNDTDFLTMSKRLHAITSEMQEEMIKTRMQPVGSVLNKFVRTVRDLSVELKKEIKITISGGETELDKSILEAIKDPLTHIVRNACDHGIESPEVRKSLGKPEIGTLQISSYHEGGQVILEITDDGKGLDVERICQKAIEKGILRSEQVHSLSDKEKRNLIFAPGFSTAQSVTSVSGRGVGMDVVRTNIEKIGGTVEVHSVAGQGTQIKIRLPLTLAIIPALLIRCGQKRFALPQAHLQELLQIDPHRVETVHGASVFRLRGQLLPLVDLRQVLKISGSDPQSEKLNVAVVTAEKNFFGLVVDQILDTSDIVVKPLNRLIKGLHVYSAATILGDGSVALILDINGVAKVARLFEGGEVQLRHSEETSSNALMHEYLLVRAGSPTKFALPLASVFRLEIFPTERIEVTGSHRVVRYGNTLLPIVTASDVLGHRRVGASRSVTPVVVFKHQDQMYGLEVEEILDTFSTEIPLKEPLSKERGIQGNLSLADELVVVLNPSELIEPPRAERLAG
jgi:two-component system chemotaxis sensor kinase CheA